ncbi:hypothetical protein LEP1GSC145_1998 [Leptospira interrogans serovar Djasiman str. LT1649]|uniref:Uncharacterized protein n=3 Tax=Leptospira interrogans TaxID=173 RepID=A0A0E2DAB3_LEPIR|nr:hypothetical protein LEP1GSC045_4494 [Leptospira interrogans serovar Pomona str. Kennewicki LC82-25]EKN86293.1 hypothetical protein LEP1GSC027_2356 [Leptospira interrogans str. 2002000624]EKN98202.1 hypothetical protein LEP1GSC014_1103 [Leptospira interrogans serovar Pomona str. Pomona]EKO05576.1 hypothetical protein LEP1GSC077_3483 [Leptospira interrogans str. C10069]EKO98919.1 hypothetical protein LEP1GSC057_0776 [Leptospira interrogans str. Brem 329]EKQ36519.1 hypothetical protein LEP1GS
MKFLQKWKISFFLVELQHKIKPLYYKKIIIHTKPNEV